MPSDVSKYRVTFIPKRQVDQKETTAGLRVTSDRTGRTASENLKTGIRNVIWFAANGIICTRLGKVQYYEILWRVLTMVSAFSVLKDGYMYRTVVTICTPQWSLYVPPL